MQCLKNYVKGFCINACLFRELRILLGESVSFSCKKAPTKVEAKC